MTKENIWNKSKSVNLIVNDNIKTGFDVLFEDGIEKELVDKLNDFINWVSNNYNIPITLYLEVVNKLFVIGEDGKRKGYLFYWSDFKNYPHFDDEEECPILILPAKGLNTHWSFDEILSSFIEGLTDYFAWISNVINDDYDNCEEADEILQLYLDTLK